MKIAVIGTGYVGLVSGACLADIANDVLCLDVDPAKIRILEEGGIPIFEPGLQELIKRNVAAGRLHFTTDVKRAAHFGTVQFIAAGTPPDEDGSADMKYVLAAAPQHRQAHDRLQGGGGQKHGARGHGRPGARRHIRRAVNCVQQVGYPCHPNQDLRQTLTTASACGA